MMTLREGIIPSSSAHTKPIDPQKAKITRRRRSEIIKFKSSCRDEAQNGVVYGTKVSTSTTSSGKSKSTCGAHGVVSVMGRRREMEDTVRVERCFVDVGVGRGGGCKKYDFFGVYDGHGGRHVAEACRDRIHAILGEEIVGKMMDECGDDDGDRVDWEVVVQRCFERMDEEVCGGRTVEDVEEMTVGSTVVAAVVGEDEVVVANCGDSRAVLCRDGVPVPLSCDHKPDRPDELARIEAAGGRVINWNGFRVLGVLATSRSIGDHHLKPYVSSKPEVTISKRKEADEFLILASDGLWDVISNELACNVVRRCLTGKIQRKLSQEFTNGLRNLNRSSRAEVAATLLTELAIAEGSKDNISVIVIELQKFNHFNCL